jgi:hypothetical protein
VEEADCVPILTLFSPPPWVSMSIFRHGTGGDRTIARRVGYYSEEAFSRAFKRSHGSSPSSWRATRELPVTS